MEAFAPYIQRLALWAVPVLAAVVLHEVAHGYVAYRLGDSTAARLGRLTLNPFAHIDLFGTVVLPLMLLFGGAPFLFGYAKPLPVPDNEFLTSNLVVIARMAQYSVLMNVGLAVFNLLPLPPLDGGRVATGLLPQASALALARLEPYGMLIIMVLLMSGVLDRLLH